MRYLLFIFVLFSCGKTPDNAPVDTNSIELMNTKIMVQDSLRFMQESILIKTTNARYNHIVDSLKMVIDGYQKDIATMQLDQIHLEKMKAMVRNLQRDIVSILEKITVLNEHNQQAHDSILLAKHKIQSEQEHLSAITVENLQLQKSLKERHSNFQPLLSQISIKPCKFVRSNPVETYKSKDVKRIEIRYVVNPNPKDTSNEKHVIKASLLKALGFRGLSNSLVYKNEINYKELITFDVDAFIPGDYLVKITIDEEQVYLTTLTLK